MNPNTIGDFLSQQTWFSRRRRLEFLKKGLILVNGKPISDDTYVVNPLKDKIVVNKKPIVYRAIKDMFFKFHKPKNTIVSMEDPKGRRDLRYYLQKMPIPVFPVGRLDRQTSGLLLLTNNGQVSQALMHPRGEVEKRYEITLDKPFSSYDFQRLESGIILSDGPCRPSLMQKVSKKELLLGITMGRSRIIRRAFEYLGYEVVKLKRISIGLIVVSGVKMGTMSPCTKAEVQFLRSLCLESKRAC